MSILKGQIWTDGYLPSADNGSFLPISLNTDGSVRTDFGQTLVDGYVAVDFGEIKSSDSYACYATLAAGDKDIVALFGTHSRLIYFGSYGTIRTISRRYRWLYIWDSCRIIFAIRN